MSRNSRIAGDAALVSTNSVKNNGNTNSSAPIPEGAGITPASMYATAMSRIFSAYDTVPVYVLIFSGFFGTEH